MREGEGEAKGVSRLSKLGGTAAAGGQSISCARYGD